MGFNAKETKKATTLANLLGCNVSGQTIYGIKDDYHFSLNKFIYNYSTFYQLSIACDKMLSNEKKVALEKSLKVKIEYNKVNDDHIMNAKFCSNYFNQNKQANQMSNIINQVIQALKEEAINEYTNCAFCHLTKEDEEGEWVIYNGLYIYAHPSCVEKEATQEEELLKLEDANINKLPLSIIFSILGAFVGVIPAMLVLVFANYLFAILFAISPVCAFLGYKLGKAPLRWYATLTAIIASIFATFIGVMIIYALLASMANVSFMDLIKDPESGFVATILQVELFNAIGILCAWSYINYINQFSKRRNNK